MKERLAADKKDYISRLDHAVGRLSGESQKRYHRLLYECRKIVGISENLDPSAPAAMKGLRGSGLNQLLWIFLRLLTSREVLVATMSETRRDNVE